MKIKITSILLASIIALNSHAESSTHQAQYMLGKGMIGSFNLKGESTKVKYFLGLECVGVGLRGAQNCSSVQAVLMNLETNTIEQRGKIQIVSNQSDVQPTQEEIKKYLNGIYSRFIDYQSSNSSLTKKIVDDAICFFAAVGFISGGLAISAVTGGIGLGMTVAAAAGLSGGTALVGNGLSKFNHGYNKHAELVNTDSFN